jgi:SseB protein N-terminal domain
MLPIDPGDGQGSVTPARPVEDIVPFRDRVPAQAMSRGGTIIRPGAVAWGGMRDSTDSGYSSCETIERILAAVAADLGQLPGLLTELTTTQLWVPLPARHRPFTDGTAVRLPLIEAEGEDFVPCFTSVQRLTAWVDAADIPPAAPSEESQFAEGGRRWQRAGDARAVPHLVVPAVGLARRLPSGLGLALNADGANGLPLYPESVSYLARLAPAAGTPAADTPTGAAVGVGHPPVEPRALLDEIRAGLRALRFVRYASRAWLSVPGAGEGLVISVALDDPGSEARRGALIDALERACAAVPLRVPFPVDVTFPGEILPGMTYRSPDLIDEWIGRNTRPFYTRD